MTLSPERKREKEKRDIDDKSYWNSRQWELIIIDGSVDEDCYDAFNLKSIEANLRKEWVRLPTCVWYIIDGEMIHCKWNTHHGKSSLGPSAAVCVFSDNVPSWQSSSPPVTLSISLSLFALCLCSIKLIHLVLNKLNFKIFTKTSPKRQ